MEETNVEISKVAFQSHYEFLLEKQTDLVMCISFLTQTIWCEDKGR